MPIFEKISDLLGQLALAFPLSSGSCRRGNSRDSRDSRDSRGPDSPGGYGYGHGHGYGYGYGRSPDVDSRDSRDGADGGDSVVGTLLGTFAKIILLV